MFIFVQWEDVELRQPSLLMLTIVNKQKQLTAVLTVAQEEEPEDQRNLRHVEESPARRVTLRHATIRKREKEQARIITDVKTR